LVNLRILEATFKDLSSGTTFDLLTERDLFQTGKWAAINVRMVNEGEASNEEKGAYAQRIWDGEKWVTEWISTETDGAFRMAWWTFPLASGSEKTMSYYQPYPPYGVIVFEPVQIKIQAGNWRTGQDVYVVNPTHEIGYFNIYHGKVLVISSNMTFKANLNPAPTHTFEKHSSYLYDSGTEVEVYATPPFCHVFDYWEVDGVKRLENPIKIVMDSNHHLTAYFKPAT